MPELPRICATCRHYRMRRAPDLFTDADLQTPAVLKAQLEADQKARQRAQQEEQRLAAGLPFEYEPHHYAWCAHFTSVDLAERANAGDPAALAELMALGNATLDPVSGKVTPIYELCARHNPTGQCEAFEAADVHH